jgi:glutaminyl-peptide cyclotransferase
MNRIFIILVLLALSLACGDKSSNSKGNNGSRGGDATAPTVKPEPVNVPDFNADTAYAFIEKQLAFGPRVPGTASHRACGDWIVSMLKGYGATVIEQTAQVQGWDLSGNKRLLPMRNIIASYRPEKARRILFSAHWDTRPFGEEGDTLQNQPIPGANDGGSGVAVLLEMARHFSKENPRVGVDLIFWDVEDHGNSDIQDSYCLGAQYWGQNKHKPNYAAMYGINLDMVGAAGASFIPDGYSLQYGKPIVDKVWGRAIALGYEKQFRFGKGGFLIDDHYYVTVATGIPVIDIIDQRPETGRTFFGQWHTHQDDIHIIDKQTLKAAGQTMLHIAYEEQ